jgi:radical SAM superfamily enzyme YgiQ (UPF0313 family)
MKILLVYPPNSELNLKGYPLGLAYLSAALNKEQEVGVYDYNGKALQKSVSSFLKEVEEKKPDMVGISFNSFNRWGAFKILKQIKKIGRSLGKEIYVVFGGVHPSTMYGQIFDYFYDYLDFIIQSEGEKSLPALCRAIENKGDLTGISGLVYKTEKREFRANSVTDIIKNLDDLPFPDYSYVADEIKEKEIAFLISSRGCPVNCSFCSTSSFWGQNVRMNSPERIGEEVEYVKGLGAKRIFFHDDTFNLGIERTIKIAEILKKLDVEYAIQCRVTPVNEEMISHLVDSGCRHITWGAESLSEKILSRIHKNITREQVKNAFDICAKYSDKLSTSAFFCVGTPGETEETINESVGYLNKNIRSTNGPGASMLYILPGTKIYGELVKNNEFNERVWVKTDSVYYYTKEHNLKTLNRWRKKINASGIRLPFHSKYFWDYAVKEERKQFNPIRRSFRKTRKKIGRFINMLRNRY